MHFVNRHQIPQEKERPTSTCKQSSCSQSARWQIKVHHTILHKSMLAHYISFIQRAHTYPTIILLIHRAYTTVNKACASCHSQNNTAKVIPWKDKNAHSSHPLCLQYFPRFDLNHFYCTRCHNSVAIKDTYIILLRPEIHYPEAYLFILTIPVPRHPQDRKLHTRQLKIKTKPPKNAPWDAHTTTHVLRAKRRERYLSKRLRKRENIWFFPFTHLDPEPATGEGNISFPHLPNDNSSPRSECI